MPESVKRRGSSGPTIGATERSVASWRSLSSTAMGGGYAASAVASVATRAVGWRVSWRHVTRTTLHASVGLRFAEASIADELEEPPLGLRPTQLRLGPYRLLQCCRSSVPGITAELLIEGKAVTRRRTRA